MKRLEEIKKRLSEATPGPFHYGYENGHDQTIDIDTLEGTLMTIDYGPDSVFYIRARQDIEDLVKCVEVMWAALEPLRDYQYGAIWQAAISHHCYEALAQVDEILK